MEITNEEILRVITELRNNDESPCIEAKENELEVEKFGKTISAISNSCLLENREYGCIIFGVKDKTW